MLEWVGMCVSLVKSRHILVQPGKAQRLGQKHSMCTEILFSGADISIFSSFKKTNPSFFIQS